MITVTGSLAFDHIMDFPGKFSDHIMPDKIHTLNLSFLVNTLKKQRGGTAGNIAYNLALLKFPVAILATVGHDFAVPTESGYSYAQFLKDAGVDLSQIKIVDNLTSSAFIMTDLGDNQITAFYPGAMNDAASLSIKKNSPKFVVISPNDPQAMVKFAKEAKAAGIDYMMDPGMQLPSLDASDLKDMVPGSTILIGNDYEISLLKEKTGLNEQQLLDQVKVLITTLGEKGSIIQTNHETIQVNAAKPTSIIDPTGAGDGFRAGFLAGYLKGFNLKTCGQMGSTAACYAIEKYGTTNHKFSTEEFCQRYQENFGEELPLSSLRGG